MINNSKKILSLLFIFLFLSLICTGQGKRLLSPEDILAFKRLSEPQISPNSKWIAFVISQFENRKINSEIWLISSNGKVLRQITKNPRPDFSPAWSPDSKFLSFISKEKNGKNFEIYLYSLETQEIKKLIGVKGRIRDQKWSPDGRMIAFLKTDSLTKEEIERQKIGDDAIIIDENYKHTRLWLFDFRTGKIRLLTHQDMTVWHFNWSPDSKKIVVLASPIPTAEGYEYQSHLSIIDVQSGREIVLTRKTNAQAPPSFSSDGKWIVYLAPIGNFKERGIIKVIPAMGGKPVELLRDYGGNVWDVKWHPRENLLIASIAKGPSHYLCTLNMRGEIKVLFEMNYSIIPYWGNFWSVDSNGEYIAFLNEKIDYPKELWISKLDGSGKKQLTNFNNYLEKVKFGKVEVVQWTNPVDGARVEGILVKPVDFEDGKKYPLVVWLHGGPAYNWGLGSHLTNWAQLFASNGYMVLLPNFRGSSGYGMKWMMKNVRDWGNGPMSDVMSGIDYLISKGWVDENKLFVGGGSYGGYLTSWIITHTDRFKAAFVSAGVTNLVTEYALTDEPSFLIGYFNSTPYEDPEIYRKNSPLTYASNVRTPVLIVHGEKDLRVPVSQAYEFYSALKYYKAPAKLIIYPREYHGIREYTHQLDCMRRVLNWFRKHTE
ncbi:S9 family peptidase [Candidatus Aminicenantes bacterium AC-335-K20]|jgi:dipeptidyl aminopeptidase/acylaminoacyl peptidase|nr:S9 family peptidase [SCandidatus Aminicenantes bacterium Aminicenantia_JdfR_composite]MCP2596732.1 S9 family peptidase [Candidatus Aminicenantes bacterium AC-335-G13]MCP2618522.1 S9 family peptidase [Candidatus Aminicenantes bacterium AC-335-A11]MCP2619274.1 S9 family peptidase [Candidatus Aminicenantes bacterium AC-335-K20]MCP2620424.1 S9 family peptidase [Candidatus Aminicenantes bacterium AC-334-E05]